VQEAFLKPLLKTPGIPLTLVNTRSGRVLANHIVGAFDSTSRRKGLLGCDRFEEGHALVIAPTNAIHMFFMRFAIDVAFVSRDGIVVRVCHSVKPWRIAFALRAFAAVELPSGTLRHSETLAGDQLAITGADRTTMF
jgi:uncharacterized protein